MTLQRLVVAVAALGTAAGAWAGEPRVFAGAGPSIALELAGPGGPSETFAADPALAGALLATTIEETVSVVDWPVAPGDRRTVEVTRHDVYAPDARIVEAVGGAYTDHGRIGGATGRPIVLGWTNHQGLWRGGTATAEIDARKRDVETVYRSDDPATVRAALVRRGARYVVVGPLERKEYGPDLFRERAGARRVFSGEGTEVWEVAP